MEQIIIASDHAGVDLKAVLIEHLDSRGLKYHDFGTNAHKSVDYPDFAHKVCGTFGSEEALAILVCGTGIGMAMAANRHLGIRCAVCVTEEMARYARLHNDANVLALGARLIDNETAIAIVDTFLNTAYEGGRHDARVRKIDALDA